MALKLPDSRAGIALYQELVLAVQNLLRWFQQQVLSHCQLGATGVKDLVRRAANSRALVRLQGPTMVLQFAEDSSWPGRTVLLPSNLTYQLCFPFLETCQLGCLGP